MGGSLLEWFRSLYPAFVTLASLAGLGVVLWLGTKFASKTTVDQLGKTSTDHETRIRLLEEAVEQSPTRQELHDEISDLKADVAKSMAKIDGVSKQLATTNDYLHMLVGKAIDVGGKK